MEVLTGRIKRLRPLYVVAILWFALVCFAPIEPRQYTRASVTTIPEPQFWLPVLVLLLAGLYELQPNWRLWKLLNTRLWLGFGLIAFGYNLLAFILNEGFKIPVPTPAQLSGCYTTNGVMILLFMLFLVVLRKRIPQPRAWFLATLAIPASAGFWEILYQVCSWTSYYHTWFSLEGGLLHNEILFWRPHPLMLFPFILLVLCYSSLHNFRFPKITLIPSAIFIAIWVAWYSTGYWILTYCDFNQVPCVWVYTEPFSWLWYLAGRGSKVVLAITLILLVTGFSKATLTKPEVKLSPRKIAFNLFLVGFTLVVYLVIRPTGILDRGITAYFA